VPDKAIGSQLANHVSYPGTGLPAAAADFVVDKLSGSAMN